LLIGPSSLADQVLRQYINFFNAMPMVVVLPLVSLWFGYTDGARLATIVFAAIFSIILNTADGARTVPREHLEVANSFRSRKLRTILEVVLPASTPYVLAGLRLAAGRALIGAVVAEFFLAIGGLGYYILYNSRTFHHNEAFVGVLLLTAFGLGFELMVNASTQRFLPWYRLGQAAE
jgi:ABC-type nitrate/sulfonate/bicarbonate transport system permease component